MVTKVFICSDTGIIVLPGLLSFAQFSAAVGQLLFVGYWICVDCGCSFWDAFCTPSIIASTSRLCSGLSLLVVTEVVDLVVFLFLLHCLFNAYFLTV